MALVKSTMGMASNLKEFEKRCASGIQVKPEKTIKDRNPERINPKNRLPVKNLRISLSWKVKTHIGTRATKMSGHRLNGGRATNKANADTMGKR